MISYAILRRVEDIDQEVKSSFQSVMENQEQADAMLTRSHRQRGGQLLPMSAAIRDIQDIKEDNDEESYYDTESDPRDISRDSSDSESHNSVESALAVPTTDRHLVISMKVPGSCNLGCVCTCHKSRRFRSPPFLNRVIGSVFVGYRLSPIFTFPCSDLDCQMSTSRIRIVMLFRIGSSMAFYTRP